MQKLETGDQTFRPMACRRDWYFTDGRGGRRQWIDSCRQGGTYRDVFLDVGDGERALFPGDVEDGPGD